MSNYVNPLAVFGMLCFVLENSINNLSLSPFFLGNNIEIDDVRGDHDIPRSWGRLKGGITCPETNMKLLHFKDNGEKSNHMTFKDFEALKKAA